MLKRNTSDSFPGADFVAADPIAAEECCLYSTTAELAAMLGSLGVPYVFRMGKLWWDAEAAALQNLCFGAAPTISDVIPAAFGHDEGVSVVAAQKGEVEGEVWVGDAATWAESVVKVQQTVTTWPGETIAVQTVIGEFGASPPPAYVYVFNACGRGNAVGFEIEWLVE